MKKLLFILLVLIAGCDEPRDEVQLNRSDKDITLKIVHRNGGNSCTVTISNTAEAEKYKLRLKKLIDDIDAYENELSINEKK